MLDFICQKVLENKFRFLLESTCRLHGSLKRIIEILSYVKIHAKKCKYRNLPKRPFDKNKKKLEDIYSPEIIEKYYYYLSDIEKHFEKAYNQHSYAATWCLALLHFSLPWRMVDLLRLPNIDIDVIGISSFNDLLEQGMDYERANIIFNQIEQITYGMVSHKNKWSIPFVRDLHLLIQNSTALVLCELHRRNQIQSKLFEIFEGHDPAWGNFFEDDELKKFGNLKATRSLMLNIFDYLKSKEGSRSVSYSLMTKFRGHMVRENKNSNTTQIYLEISKIEGSTYSEALEAQRRGRFGFLNKILIETAYDIENACSKDVTNLMEKVSEYISPKNTEVLADYLINQKEQQEALVSELLHIPDIEIEKKVGEMHDENMQIIPSLNDILTFNKNEYEELKSEVLNLHKNEIIEKLRKIHNGELASKLKDCSCYIGINNCPYKPYKSEYCSICKYSVPTIFALTKAKTEIYSLINKIQITPVSNVFALRRYEMLLLKYIMLISGANAEYKKLGDNFISTFIDLEQLHIDVKELDRTKLVLIR